jgi:hypothetical protein
MLLLTHSVLLFKKYVNMQHIKLNWLLVLHMARSNLSLWCMAFEVG